ncbi:hypothetical protein EAS64_33000 [Trebonia kvetii]|uniref:DUF1795 domain-containing protein n=1 Tax=Trebonia kvetii TaxID=2480626 RepID=A0A6P2BQ43_9ACTN|nr:hypothetical protein [Trebonia kvetii]TVZ01114.1 hypothetical protein EAS64_33000 [Trebonia kvetii]
MDVSGVTPHPFRMLATVPEGMVSMPADGEWAAWTGFWSTPMDGRDAVILVSITVTAFDGQAAGEAGTACDVLAARLRVRHPEATAIIEEFRTPGGDPAVCLRCSVTERVRGRDVTTWQAQALVAYQSAGALGVVSGVALDPDDLDRAAALVAEIAAGMTVTVAPAAA